MDLNAINARLGELMTLLPEKLKAVQQAEYKYAVREASVFMQSGMATIAAKEKEAKLVCDQEGFYLPLTELRGDVKALLNEKDMLIEMSRNLRTLSGREEREYAK
jgi:hypothetical protein